jgi:hypothetical protein
LRGVEVIQAIGHINKAHFAKYTIEPVEGSTEKGKQFDSQIKKFYHILIGTIYTHLNKLCCWWVPSYLTYT